MEERLLRPYDPQTTEGRIYKLWLASGFFNPDHLPARHRQPYTILIAPPNITGELHLGHALENTLADALIRFKRMQGYKTLWLPGLDHAGIATEVRVEKELQKQGLTKEKLGREKFIQKVWEWKEKYGGIVLEQLKQLGCSLDWSRTRFTLDPKYQEAVQTAFNHYAKRGLIYRGERVINWCVKDQTALSDLELEYQEEEGMLWYIRYPIKKSPNSKLQITNFITVATARPETMLGDAAVAVNPKDNRFASFVGQEVTLPLVNRAIPIIADSAVDPAFGSGAVKVTPAHDLADSEIADRHHLPFYNVISQEGKIIKTNTEFDGLTTSAARQEIVEALKKQNLLEKAEPYKHRLAICYRCGEVVEPQLSKQWFLRMPPLARQAIEAIETGRVKYLPERFQEIALAWLRNVRDWCLSRQIWWGHQLPVWQCECQTGRNSKFEIRNSRSKHQEQVCKECKSKYERVPDVLDTWFSSALWPLATLGWPGQNAPDLKKFYPTQLITAGRDILHLWVARMIFTGLEFAGEVPFQQVLVHATVLTPTGERMSKSLGIGEDPTKLIEKYGADALRFALLYQVFGGQDIKFQEAQVQMGKKFANKLWNISRYILSRAGGQLAAWGQKLKAGLPAEAEEDKNLLKGLGQLVEQVTADLDHCRFGSAAHLLYNFVWHELADRYLETSKKRSGPGVEAILGYSLITSLKLLHPFMPFITEEIWGLLPAWPEKQLLLTEPWTQSL